MEDSQVIDLTAKPFRVGPWVVAPDRHELQAGEDLRRVPPRLMLLLRCLARAAGHTVSRESLLDTVWERRVLNDEVLSRSIADLRQALDDDAREPRFIQTIPKLGYRLVAEVEFDLQPTQQEPIPNTVSVAPDLSEPRPQRPATTPVKPPATRSLPNWRLAVSLLLLALTIVWLQRHRQNTPPEVPVAGKVAVIGAAELLLATPLTSSEAVEFSPRFSRDGQWLAYATATPSKAGSQIVLRSRDGTAQRQFTRTEASDACPVFVESDLVWTRYADGHCELLRQALLGDTPQVLARCAPVRSCPDLSADRRQLVYTAPAAESSRSNGLALLDLLTGKSQPLTTPSLGEGDDVDPRFAPTGELSFVRGAVGAQSLWRLALTSGARERRLPLVDSMIFGHSYLPDGQLLLASDALGFRALIKLRENQDQLQPELLGARGARYPDVASDGSVVYELAQYDANLWLYRDGAKPRRLTHSSRYEGYPMLSADAKTLVYQSNQHGYEAIYAIQLTDDQAVEQKLPLDAADRWAHPAYKRNNDALWLTRYREKTTEVWRYSAGARAAQQMTDFPPDSHDVQDDPRSEHIWFLLGESAPVTLMHRASMDAAPVAPIAEDVQSYLIDQRGLFLVYRQKPSQIWHCPAAPDMRTCSALPLQMAPGFERNWTLSDSALYFVAPATADATTRQSSRFDFADQSIKTLQVPAPSTPSHGIAVARDDSFIVIAQLDALSVDLHWWLAPKR